VLVLFEKSIAHKQIIFFSLFTSFPPFRLVSGRR
jgi:hypothetical protein